jgi:hypothetical protein
MIRSILRAVLSAILLVGAAGGAQAQLTVVSSSPVDGQLNVPTNAILSGDSDAGPGWRER